MFKKSLLAGAVILSGATATLAADFAPAPSVYDWTGLYVGLNAGAAWNNSELDTSDGLGAFVGLEETIEGDQTVFTGGAQLGYNWQWDSVVAGVETDFNFLNFDADETFDLGGGNTANFEAKANWYGTATVKLGYAMDNFLVYGDGGLAYGHSEAEGTATIAGATFSNDQSNVNWGWTLGAGMKYGINENWVVGAEYKYVDLGEADFDTDDGLGNSIRANTDVAFSVVRATLDFRF